MQYHLADLLVKDLILTGLRPADRAEAIKLLVESMVQAGAVALAFLDDVLAREEAFPTGLPTQPIPVAIPHADPTHVLRSAVAVGILDTPVAFHQMGMDGGATLEVPIVFVLAIKEKEKQVEMLQELISAIQDATLLGRLHGNPSPEDVLGLLSTGR